MRDLSREMMVAAELRGDLVRINVIDKEDQIQRARDLLASGRPTNGPTDAPGFPVYSFFYSEGDSFPDEDDPQAYQAVIHIFNTNPPQATCRVIYLTEHVDITRNDLGPFVCKFNDRVVAMTVMVEDEDDEEEDEA